LHVPTDGFTQVDPERAESLSAVRSVLADVLDRDGGWAELAEAGLLGLAVPEAYGGEGLGLPEVSLLLRETGTRARHLPFW
jgi:3-oxo-4-pregnene-20-carboxyl-CoA dehydrogenase beta subunit